MKTAALSLVFVSANFLAGQVVAAGGLRSREEHALASSQQRDLSFDNPCAGSFSISSVDFKWVVTEYEDERPVDIEGSKITWGKPATSLGRSSFEATTVSPINDIPPDEPFKLADLKHINNILKRGSALKNVDLVMDIRTDQADADRVDLGYAVRVTETSNNCSTGPNCSDDIIQIIKYNNAGESNGVKYEFDLFFKESADGPIVERFQTPERGSTNLGLYGMFTVLGGTCPPIAQCKDTIVYADGKCQAPSVSIDNGSYDIDSDAITIIENFDGPAFALGANVVTLTASDGERETTCEGTVTVLDVSSPGVCCSISPVSGSPHTYSVEFSARDNCSGVTATAKIVSRNKKDKCDDIVVSSSGDTVTVQMSDDCKYEDGVDLLVTATDMSGNKAHSKCSAPALFQTNVA